MKVAMKIWFLAALCSFSLSACAQPAASSQVAAKAQPAVASVAVDKTHDYPAGSAEQRISTALHSLNAQLKIDSIAPAPIPGFHQVVAGGDVVYVSDDGKYLFHGGLIDIAKRQDMGALAMAEVRKGILAGIPMADRIVFAPSGKARYTVVVLTDVECGYCRKFHSEINEYNRRGIRVEYLAFPRAGVGSADYQKMVAVWCAKDRKQALTDAKNGIGVPAGNCQNSPVAMEYAAGLRMGLEGTPMILTTNGLELGGYLPPDVLLQRLQTLAEDADAG